MRKRNANFLYALMNLFLWGTIGALVTYASRFYLHLGLSNTVSGVLLAAVIGSSILLQPVLTAVVERLHVSVQRIICTAAAMILACCLPLLALADTKSAAVPLMCLACLCVQTQPAFVNALGVCAAHQLRPLPWYRLGELCAVRPRGQRAHYTHRDAGSRGERGRAGAGSAHYGAALSEAGKPREEAAQRLAFVRIFPQ